MRHERTDTRIWRQRLARCCIALAGIVASVACGGGGGGPDCSFFSDTCTPQFPPIEFPLAAVDPSRLTVQAGSTAVFTAFTSGIQAPTYQWQRAPAEGAPFVEIAGATGKVYSRAGVELSDDGSLYRVRATGSNGSDLSLPSVLQVSSQPAVVFEDADFADANWSADFLADPAPASPTHTEARVATGGNPDAFRRVTFPVQAGPSSQRVFSWALQAVYDPATQGALYAIDYAEQCQVLTTGVYFPTSALSIQQGGRRYESSGGYLCNYSVWTQIALHYGMTAANFTLVDGPPCGSGESCPDFSATAAPLRFGFVRGMKITSTLRAGTVDSGIDNWKVTLWRR